MVREITLHERMELFIDTLERCSIDLISASDEVIEYNIFEEFDTGVVSFLHIDNLTILNKAGMIDDEIVNKAKELRKLVLILQKSTEWSLEFVKTSSRWRIILELSDDIKKLIR
ncbi:hypothetical protein V7101_20580 [Bacillus velezensis]|uniref:hypothetical protein n=1 Tax=Bacillus velezensis TaxID=492670 RepID=UPI0030007AA3